ncbi:hypothetical protein FZC76_14815 [Sutcliffiella horikoshii]|uniref:Uncharacterized protein n=1 Tax=Sutcliffiella horikoshii TaxID=79883 RepID=A0A5D4SZR3_9BACI|nr:hypothetical protein [Sutcliffiella horikoshii]TYS67828.1 hypothetical protein FZC76_14815 [Sutcliffiella horikoshii]
MFTYQSFEIDGSFALLRPILYMLLAVSILLFILIVVPKFKAMILSTLMVIILSLLNILVAAQVMVFSAIAADELNFAGDSVGMILFMSILAISALNMLLFLKRNRSKQELC